MSDKPIDQIAWDMGYLDPVAFRKIFPALDGNHAQPLPSAIWFGKGAVVKTSSRP